MNLFALISWALYTPLLKIPLLVSEAILNHIALTPPNPSPSPVERRKYVGPTVEGLPLHITPTFVVGSTLAVSGGLTRLWCYRTLGRFFACELSVQDGRKLVTSGPYAIIRHPSYIS
ncbi:hypothetical protein TRAPUB_2117 [Trametes pubescens]|uniref:Protein-S-isoprenylcysteine O-methyltransferase n=1 Tax=Trametes pubescens TaxID=154538 RepID=A0A1M2VHK4_TRAPU|nr:hypothetical protein TRAPUB_2117 [Trametes pubescens]